MYDAQSVQIIINNC